MTRSTLLTWLAVPLLGGIAAVAVRAGGCTSPPSLPERTVEAGPALVTIIPARNPRGVMATSGGWAYCQQLRALSERTHYTLVCGKYAKDRYAGRGLRNLRHLDSGNPGTSRTSLSRSTRCTGRLAGRS